MGIHLVTKKSRYSNLNKPSFPPTWANFSIFSIYVASLLLIYIPKQENWKLSLTLVSHNPQIPSSGSPSWLAKCFFRCSLLCMPSLNALVQSFIIFYETNGPVSVTLASNIDPHGSVLCKYFQLALYCLYSSAPNELFPLPISLPSFPFNYH